jgi:hypothetical protein
MPCVVHRKKLIGPSLERPLLFSYCNALEYPCARPRFGGRGPTSSVRDVAAEELWAWLSKVGSLQADSAPYIYTRVARRAVCQPGMLITQSQSSDCLLLSQMKQRRRGNGPLKGVGLNNYVF